MSEGLHTAHGSSGVDAAALAPQTACSVLVEWANKQDHWVRKAVGEVLAGRQELPEATIDEVYRAYRVEKGLDKGDAEKVACGLGLRIARRPRGLPSRRSTSVKRQLS